MEPNYSWIYLLIFLIIPLSRIIPRLIANRRAKPQTRSTDMPGMQMPDSSRPDADAAKSIPARQRQAHVEGRGDLLVLGTMHRGANTFEKIQKSTKIPPDELDDILGQLEDEQLIKIVTKQGVLGAKVELYSTEKGFKKYYS